MPHRFSVYYVVDRPGWFGLFWRGGRGYVSKDMIRKHLPAPDKDTLIMVRLRGTHTHIHTHTHTHTTHRHAHTHADAYGHIHAGTGRNMFTGVFVAQ